MKKYFLFVSLIFSLLLFAACRRDLGVDRAYFCDDFADEKCILPQSEDRTYSFELPAEKAVSWFELAYFMYFHARQTPGFRVDFNHSPNAEEMKRLRTHLECSYRLIHQDREVKGHLEGRRIDEEGFWCFDYLGTMLVKYHKTFGSIKDRPSGDFFPVIVELSYNSDLPGIKGTLKSSVRVEWKINGRH